MTKGLSTGKVVLLSMRAGTAGFRTQLVWSGAIFLRAASGSAIQGGTLPDHTLSITW